MELATALDWPPSRVTALEQSHDPVKVDTRILAALTRDLRFPGAFFTSPPSAPLTPDDILFRTPATTTKREKTYLAEFARLVGDMLTWLDSYHRLPPVKIPPVPQGTPIAEAARLTRAALGVAADEPIVNLTHRMERAGVPIVVRSPNWNALPEKHLGYSARIGDHGDRPVTVLRSQDSWERTRWTVAHELGHLVLHGASLPANAEDQAHEFAGELLAPADVIRGELPRFVTLAELTPLKLRWGVSLGGLIPHLSRHDLISDERKETLRKQLYTRINPATGRTWGKDEPGWDTRQVELPSLITAWMQRSLGGTAANLIAELSEIWPADIITMIISRQKGLSRSASSPSRATGVWSRPRTGGAAANTSRASGSWRGIPNDSGAGVIDLGARRRRALFCQTPLISLVL